MTGPWDKEERAWAAECFAAGDTIEDVAEMSGRSVEDVRLNAPRGIKLTSGERLTLQLYTAGTPYRDIGRALKADSPRPDSLAASYVRILRRKGFTLPDRLPGRSVDAEARRYA